MAVKVMLAPAIVKRELEKAAARSARGERKPAAKPRRRSSVYDADGNEVFITLMCLKCRKMRPLSQFGLRKMADGAIRNQPWCRTCRSASSEKPRGGEAAGTGESPAIEASPPALDASAPDAAPSPGDRRRPSGAVATEVAAALAAGLGR
jgi:hypothetical protein